MLQGAGRGREGRLRLSDIGWTGPEAIRKVEASARLGQDQTEAIKSDKTSTDKMLARRYGLSRDQVAYIRLMR